LRVIDLHIPVSLALAWRRDNISPLLARFMGQVQRLPGRVAGGARCSPNAAIRK